MKNKNKLTLLVLTTLAAVSCSTTPPPIPPTTDEKEQQSDRNPANGFNCMDAASSILNPKNENVATMVAPKQTKTAITEKLAKRATRYPNGFEGREGMHIQYGFESEYLHHESTVLLQNYMPTIEHYKGSKEDWLALTHEERANFIEARASSIFPYRQKGKLVKISTDPELDAVLPDSFVFDAGHYEIVLAPMDTAEEVAKKIKVINAKIGVGSMQLTISNPIEKDVLASSKVLREQAKGEILGYYNFMNEMDTLSKMTTGYERFLKNPDSETVKSFNHPWLGPMTALKHDRLVNIMDNVLAGKKYTDDELSKMSSLVVSHKFIGGLSFRPDVAFKKSRLASEVRDCHQNVKCIENRLMRETYFLMKGKMDFSKFSDLKSFDSVTSFDMLSKDIRSMLRTAFPKYGQYSQTEMELFRNFSYPMRDWSKHIEHLGKPELNNTVAEAQQEYLKKLDDIAQELTSGKIKKQDARNKVMGALGEFSKKSGIADALNEKYEELANPEELKFFESLKLTLHQMERLEFLKSLAA
jgi:hypothetical protein